MARSRPVGSPGAGAAAGVGRRFHSSPFIPGKAGLPSPRPAPRPATRHPQSPLPLHWQTQSNGLALHLDRQRRPRPGPLPSGLAAFHCLPGPPPPPRAGSAAGSETARSLRHPDSECPAQAAAGAARPEPAEGRRSLEPEARPSPAAACRPHPGT
uniref:Uncharacterized protein n=1 Tax=Sciurus vulgaris TaxID=55149 RepID=A0A8D2ADV5_SCIVU